MNFGPLLLALASAVLIVAGVFVMLRDGRTKRAPSPSPELPTQTARTLRTAMPPPSVAEPHDVRDSPAPQRFSESNAEVTIVRREVKPAGMRSVAAGPSQSAFAALQTAVAAITSEASNDATDSAAEGQRWPSVESRWPLTENQIEQALGRFNETLEPVALRIGKAGEAGWSFKNRGFGSYRRVVIADRSVAWLRVETNQEQVITLKVRAHAVDHALLNATASLPGAGVDAAQLLEALSVCLRPAAEYAAWCLPKSTADSETERDAWSDLGALTTEAYAIAAGALKEANAELMEVARPSWDPTTGRTRWALAVAVAKARAADIIVDLDKRHFEIASHATAGTRGDLGRKRRLDLDGLTAHGLAEAIAASAWPAVAAALEKAGGKA